MRPQRALMGVYTCSLIQWCTCSHRNVLACKAGACGQSDAQPKAFRAQSILQHGPTPSSSPRADAASTLRSSN